jgi:hypothetical protein
LDFERKNPKTIKPTKLFQDDIFIYLKLFHFSPLSSWIMGKVLLEGGEENVINQDENDRTSTTILYETYSKILYLKIQISFESSPKKSIQNIIIK